MNGPTNPLSYTHVPFSSQFPFFPPPDSSLFGTVITVIINISPLESDHALNRFYVQKMPWCRAGDVLLSMTMVVVESVCVAGVAQVCDVVVVVVLDDDDDGVDGVDDNYYGDDGAAASLLLSPPIAIILLTSFFFFFSIFFCPAEYCVGILVAFSVFDERADEPPSIYDIYKLVSEFELVVRQSVGC